MIYYPNIALLTCSSDYLQAETVAKNSFVANAGFYPSDTAVNSLQGYGASASANSVHSQRPQNGVFSIRLPASVTIPNGGSPSALTVFGAAGATPASKADNIKDGLTQTIAFSENLLANSWGYTGDITSGDTARFNIGMVWLYRTENGAPIPGGRPSPSSPLNPANKINGDKAGQTTPSFDNARPSSGHTGVVNVAFLSGTVISMSDQVDYNVYQALLTPNTRASDMPQTNYILKEDDFGGN